MARSEQEGMKRPTVLAAGTGLDKKCRWLAQRGDANAKNGSNKGL
ncbi:hypothetical protein [Bacillus luti]|nr:hypothetical protein [Bacillus luti]